MLANYYSHHYETKKRIFLQKLRMDISIKTIDIRYFRWNSRSKKRHNTAPTNSKKNGGKFFN
jgi:hypothetical protein